MIATASRYIEKVQRISKAGNNDAYPLERTLFQHPLTKNGKLAVEEQRKHGTWSDCKLQVEEGVCETQAISKDMIHIHHPMRCTDLLLSCMSSSKAA